LKGGARKYLKIKELKKMINAVIVVGTRQNQVQKNKEGTD